MPPLTYREKSTRTGTWSLSWSGLGFFPKPYEFPLLLALPLQFTEQTRGLVESMGSRASRLAQILALSLPEQWPWAAHSTSLSSASNKTIFHWLQLNFSPCFSYFWNWDVPYGGLRFSFLAHEDIFSGTQSVVSQIRVNCRASRSPLPVTGSHKITSELITVSCPWWGLCSLYCDRLCTCLAPSLNQVPMRQFIIAHF